ncbi:MAG TPA: hypothetical protein VFQ61_32600 [Polyangiaceae bacterium]|nr:hypothetical protein [Polyangiaceae bacterium]
MKSRSVRLCSAQSWPTQSGRARFWTATAACAPLFGALACGSSSGATTTEPHPTIVEVGPSAFDGALACSAAGVGTLRSYVATLKDETASRPGSSFYLPSSSATPCQRAVAFGAISPLHRYSVELDGYDRDGLEPFAPGLRAQRDPETNELVTPRWKATCEAVQAEYQLTVPVLLCSAWSNGGSTDPGAEARVSLEVAQVLGAECEASTPRVDRVEVRSEGEVLAEGACGETLTLTFSDPSDSVHELELLAYAPSAEQPLLGGVCEVRTAPGTTLPATCAPLSDVGGIHVQVSALLQALQVRCEDLGRLVVSLDATESKLTFDSHSCNGNAAFMAVEPGTHVLDVEAWARDSTQIGQTQCTADVEPGLVSSMACGSR